MSLHLTTDAELAEQFGLTLERFTELRRKHEWPYVKLGRFAVRFTDAQVEHIVAMQTTKPKPVGEPSVVTSGQTPRSAARRRSA